MGGVSASLKAAMSATICPSMASSHLRLAAIPFADSADIAAPAKQDASAADDGYASDSYLNETCSFVR